MYMSNEKKAAVILKNLPSPFYSPVLEELLKGIKASEILEKLINNIGNKDEINRAIEKGQREYEKAVAKGIKIITLSDRNYPELLKNITNPPIVFYALGSDVDFNMLSVSLVGTRRPTRYGLKVAELFSSYFAETGLRVISGMAMGIDSRVHSATLNSTGVTIAVLGTGVDVPYPRSNLALYRKIIERGCVISEFAPGTTPLPFRFPLRNRIIAGLSRATVVVEAPLNSGALITARLAAEYGRDVYSVPGEIFSLKSRGSNHLIREGAILVTSPEEVVRESYPEITDQKSSENLLNVKELSETEKKILNMLSNGELHTNEILRRLNKKPEELLPLLTEMEIKGFIVCSQGYVSRRS